ncbi:response regulator [Paraburkholderia caledonica]|uniref:response regulator n=1 Tax=Paraburkholderia caledonica TaxID=134536 RepID=UPI0003695FA0
MAVRDQTSSDAKRAAVSVAHDFLYGGGEMGALLRAHNWSATPLGEPETWPQSLRSALSICLEANFPIAIYWGPELALLYNDAWSSIPGKKHPGALGRPGREVWPEIWDTIGPLFHQVQESGAGVWQHDQLLPMHRHGYTEECYFNFTFSPIRGEGGQVEGIFNAVLETTSSVLAERRERALRELAEALAARRDELEVFAVAATLLATKSVDVPFSLLYRIDDNAQQAHLMGLTGVDRDSAAAPAVIALSEADTPWPLASVLHTGQKRLVEDLAERFTTPLPGGPWPEPCTQALILPIQSTAHPGTVAAILVAGISPRGAADDDYQAFLERAASHIATSLASARAYEEERRRAEALAEIDRAKTTFFSNVSHEFRTPLTLMLGPIEELLADPEQLGEEGLRQIQLAHRNGLRLLKLVNSLLDFSRIEAGRLKASFQATDLAQLTTDLASNFRSAMERAGLTLTVDCETLTQPVYVDRDMWEKIVLNLLSNAFKFTFEGGVSVELRQRDTAELVVRDTGTGIPEAELPRIFERFHRIEGARGRSFEGSGIGLALVEELVRLHGGTVRVESEIGKGTVFTVAIPFGAKHLATPLIEHEGPVGSSALRVEAYVGEAERWLPDAQAPHETSDRERIGESVTAAARPAIDGAHILLADDNADMRAYVQRLLGGSHHVEVVADGQAALETIRRRRPDLLLTDIMMPRLDGFGLIRSIRGDATLKDLPIIALSARAGEEASLDGLAAGADDYLVKPFSARELVARVDSALAMATLRRQMSHTLRDEANLLEVLNKIGATIAAELDLDQAVQVVTDAAKELTGAAFGAFFYNVLDERGERYTLYSISGVPREAFSKFPMPRNTKVFAPTFNGEAIVRSADIKRDPRYGNSAPYFGMPEGHLPVCSYLAAPVVSRSGEVLGGLFFGHPEPDVFTERAERLLLGVAAQAAIAIDNARLYQAAQTEIAQRTLTEQALRESEERQLRLNETLEAKVVERTLELQAANEQLLTAAEERERVEEALRHAQKMEAIGKLTGGVAHDFNNLLQVIAGNLQLLARDINGHEAGERRLRNALAGVTRGSKLASQLLAFGRRQPMRPKVVNLGRFVRDMDDMLRRALGEEIEIETVISGGLWNTMVDPSQVENALLNLAINARDAMKGRGKLTIEAGNASLDAVYAAAHPDVRPGQYVMLAVTDTGSGMSGEVMEHAFEPFFTTKPEGQGTGLGLSMVWGVVKQSEGHIKIYSEVGEGTTIRIYLPRSRQEEDRTPEAETAPAVGGTETILVVEDDEDVRNTVVDMLTDLGYRVLKARDAQSGWAIIESGVPIDLLFTDVVMPGPLRSPELARKARERLPDIAVLFTSGYTENAIVHGGRLDEGIELLSKPYTREALARRLRHVLANQRQLNSQRPAPAVRARPARERPVIEVASPALRVLLVEDEELILMSTGDMLESLGHRVFTAASGEQALPILDAHRVDVLVVDLGLPGMSGSELAVQARKKYPKLHVVIASGNPDPSVLSNEWLAGAVILAKPYDEQGLTRAIRGKQ